METQITFTDRYAATGTPYPNPETMCEGQCEGMGVVPIYMNKDVTKKKICVLERTKMIHCLLPFGKRLIVFIELK